MRAGRIIYGVLGAALLAGTISTAARGLSQENMDIYNQAVGRQEEIDELGFDGFCLEGYRVRFYDGTADYVVETEQVTKEKPVLETFVGTAYPVGDHYEIVVPTVEHFEKLFQTAGAVGGIMGGDKDAMQEGSYGAEEHTATIWHEAFHAYQLTHYEKQIDDLAAVKISEETIVKYVDADQAMQTDYQKELALLKEALMETEPDAAREKIRTYIGMYHERQKRLPEEAIVTEGYYETIEGSAFYIEAHINDPQRYIEELGAYSGGSYKYYQTGMAKCMLLDKIDNGWKNDYDFSMTIEEVLEKAVGE